MAKKEVAVMNTAFRDGFQSVFGARVFTEDFLPAVEAAKAAAQAIKNEEERPAPFGGGTPPFAEYTKVQYQKLLDDWFQKLSTEEQQPNSEQMEVLRRVRDRVLEEIILEKEGPVVAKKRRLAKQEDTREEPLRAFVPGLPGTGKSRVIEWIVRLFTEAWGWEHGVQFVCVAFQNQSSTTD